jgi:hypothetical protein
MSETQDGLGSGRGSSESKIFLTIIDGKVTRKAKEGEPNAVSRINKNQVTVWEVKNDFICGILENISIEKNENMKDRLELILSIRAGGKLYEFQVPLLDKFGQSLCARLPFLELGQWFKFTPYSFQDKTKVNKKGEPKVISGMNVFTRGIDGVETKIVINKDNGPKTPEWPGESADEDEKDLWKLEMNKFYKKFAALQVIRITRKGLSENGKPAVTEQQASTEGQGIYAQIEKQTSYEVQAPISGGIGDNRPLSEIAGSIAPENDLPFMIALLLSIGTLIPF